MDVKRMMQGAVDGSSAAVVGRLERPLARRTPFSTDGIRAAAGALLLFWSVRRIVRAVRAGAKG